MNKVPAGFLEPLTLPEQKWADVSMDFIMGLPRSNQGNDGILTVVDRATKMVHLVPVKQAIIASEHRSTGLILEDFMAYHVPL